MQSDLFEAFRRRVDTQLDFLELPWRTLDNVTVAPLSLPPRARLYNEGDEVKELFVVRAGWLVRSSLMRNGKRYIHRVYQAGDLIGTEDMNWNYATCTVETVTRSRLGRFRKEAQQELFVGSGCFGAVLHGLSMNEQVVMMDAARANARLGASERIAHLLLQTEARTRLSDTLAEGDPFEFPLSQSDIGDTTGLTNVSVSKAMGRLTKSWAIFRERSSYRILERERLIESCDFVNRYRVAMDNWRRLLEAA